MSIAVLDWAQIITAIAAAIAAGVAIWQTAITRKQFNSAHRARIAVAFNGIRVSDTGKVTARLKNYGQLPAFKIKIWFGFQLTPFTREMLEKINRKPVEEEAAIFPNSEREAYSQIPDYPIVLKEKHSVQMALVIEYVYGDNKRSEYYLTAYYNPSNGEQGGRYEYAK